MKRTKVKELLSSVLPGSEVLVKGWVRTKRGNKSIVFIALNDGSTIRNIQVVMDMSSFEEDLLKDVTTGACIAVTGKVVKSQGQGQNIEIHATNLAMQRHILFRRKDIQWNS
jgi:asparaginyl-tRNA synthetase